MACRGEKNCTWREARRAAPVYTHTIQQPYWEHHTHTHTHYSLTESTEVGTASVLPISWLQHHVGYRHGDTLYRNDFKCHPFADTIPRLCREMETRCLYSPRMRIWLGVCRALGWMSVNISGTTRLIEFMWTNATLEAQSLFPRQIQLCCQAFKCPQTA